MAVHAPPGIESEYRLLRTSAGAVELGRGALEVRGPDAIDFLQGQVTNDVTELEPGTGCYALLLNPKGRILADMRILMRTVEDLIVDTEPETLEQLLSHLTKYKIGRQVEVERSDLAARSVIGPLAREASGLDVPEREHSFAEVEIGGARAVALATDLGVDVLSVASGASAVAEALASRGVQPASEDAAEILRIESGRPRYGRDMSDENHPGEIGLEERAVSFSKGCYVGQEPVARMHYKGHPNRHLRGLELSEPAKAGDALAHGDREVGHVSSACVSPTLGPIALALVRREVDPGSTVAVGGAATQARVVELPFEARDA